MTTRAVGWGLAAVFLVAGCTDIGSEPVPEDRAPAEIQLEVDNDRILAGDETTASVRVLDEGGEPFERLPPWMTLESSDRGVFTVHDGATLRAEGSGAATLRLRWDELGAEHEIRVNPNDLDLEVASIHLNQAVQELDGSIPLVANRAGFLRVFLRGDQDNFFEPDVRVRLYHGGSLQESLTLEPTQEGIPTEVDEDVFEGSWGASIPADLVVPELEVVVEADPDGLIPLKGGGTTLRYPDEGRKALDVHELPQLKLTLIPVEQPDGDGGTIGSRLNEGNADAFVSDFLRQFPVAEDYDIEVREPFLVSTRADDRGSWSEILGEVRALQAAEGGVRYYYGLLRRFAGPLGIANVGRPAGIGFDDLFEGARSTLAHELGHNMGVRHSPCGRSDDDTSVDEDFPHDDGSIASAGIDVARERLHPSSTPDLMGRCRPRWLGDYFYDEIFRFRRFREPVTSDTPPVAADGGSESGAAAEPGSLLVFGNVEGGEVTLSPALRVDAPPQLPDEGGAYVLEGEDAGGGLLFQLPFDPDPVADAGPERGNFVFVLPPDLAQPEDLAEIRVRSPSGVARQVSELQRDRPEVLREPEAPEAPAEVSARETGGGVEIRWDASERPLIAVRDPDTHRVLAFGRDGRMTVPGDYRELVVDVSHGTGSESVRLQVEPGP